MTLGGVRPGSRVRRTALARAAVVLIVVLGSSGCYHATVRIQSDPVVSMRTTVVRMRSHAWLEGLIGPKPVDAQERCGAIPAQVETKISFMNKVVDVVTGGIYTPMTIEIRCVAP
jgi:hypothetical protein